MKSETETIAFVICKFTNHDNKADNILFIIYDLLTETSVVIISQVIWLFHEAAKFGN